MVKIYRVIGEHGSFITYNNDFKKGDFTNTTGDIIKVIEIKKKLRKISHLGNTKHNPFHATDAIERKLKEMF